MKKKNGLHTFAIHQFDDANEQLAEISKGLEANSLLSAETSRKYLSPEIAAKQCLNSLAEKEGDLQKFFKPKSTGNAKLSFDPIRTEYIPLTGNKMVKFRQRINDISVFGSAINVELNEDNQCVSVIPWTALELPAFNSAAISPLQSKLKAAEYVQHDIEESVTPLLYYYYFNEQWKLVYILRDIETQKKKVTYPIRNHHSHTPALINIVVDASNGDILEITPAVMGFDEDFGTDENGETHKFSISNVSGTKVLKDEILRVSTYQNNFDSYLSPGMPGSIVTKNNEVWSTAAVSAHVNACKVAIFLRDVLRRNNVDGAGLELISSVECTEHVGEKTWLNAVWLKNRRQMAYGQLKINKKFRSLAVSLDVVAHEIFHGVTQFTSSLQYHNQPGALNESYSDIFGVILSNFNNGDVNTWNWEIGEDIMGKPFRNIENPTLFGQPDHMDNFDPRPDTEEGDFGGIHTNSGIHNKTAFLILTAKNDEAFVFTPAQVAQLYYLALIQLNETSEFADSYGCMKNAAKSLFKNDSSLAEKLKAVDVAFNRVGIFL